MRRNITNSPGRKLLYDTDNKEEDEEGNNRSWNLTITAGKYEDVVEEAHHHIPTKKVENNSPSNSPTDPAKQISPHKRLPTSSVQATGTSQNTSRWFVMSFCSRNGWALLLER